MQPAPRNATHFRAYDRDYYRYPHGTTTPRRAAPPALASNDPELRHDTTALNWPSAGLRRVARSPAGSASSGRVARGST